MTNAQHTPGPWAIHEHHNAKLVIREQVSPDKDIICTVQGVAPGIAADIRANASLIAAAPELLEALKGFLDLREDSGNFHLLEAARAAIATAGGMK